MLKKYQMFLETSVVFLLCTGVLIFCIRYLFLAVPIFTTQLVNFYNFSSNNHVSLEQVKTEWDGLSPVLSVGRLSLRINNEPYYIINGANYLLSIDLVKSIQKMMWIFAKFTVDQMSVEFIENKRKEIAKKNLSMILKQNAASYYLPRLSSILHRTKKIYINEAKFMVGHNVFTMNFIKDKALNINIKQFKRDYQKHSQVMIYGYKEDGMWRGNINFELLNLSNFFYDIDNKNKIFEFNSSVQWSLDKHLLSLNGPISLKLEDCSSNNDVSLQSYIHTVLNTSDSMSHYHVAFNNNIMSYKDDAIVINNIELNIEDNKLFKSTLEAETIDLQFVSRLLENTDLGTFIPDEWRKSILQYSLDGILHNVEAYYYPFYKTDPLKYRADLKNISWNNDVQGIVMKNISGQIQGRLNKGTIHIDSEKLYLDFRNLFHEGLYYSSAKGDFVWKMEDSVLNINSENFLLSDVKHKLQALLHISVPMKYSKAFPFLNLKIEVDNGDHEIIKQYIPVHLINEDLKFWLNNAILEADFKNGIVHVDGFLSNPSIPTNWSIALDVQKGHLKYHKDWPSVRELKGKININNDLLKMDIDTASTLNTKINTLSASLSFDKNLILDLKSKMDVDGQDFISILTETPLKKDTGTFIDWKIKGTLPSTLKLMLPINSGSDAKVDLNTKANNINLILPYSDLKINDLNGDFSYSTGSGLNVKKLNAKAFGGDLEGYISSKVVQKNMQTQLEWTGSAQAERVQNWLKPDYDPLVKGLIPYKASLDINNKSHQFANLSVSADLFQSHFLKPLPKVIKQSLVKPLNFSLLLLDNKKEMKIKLNNVMFAQFYLDQNDRSSSGLVYFGENTYDKKFLKDKIVISGNIPDFSIDPWLSYFTDSNLNNKYSKWINKLIIRDLNIKKVDVKKTSIMNLLINSENYTDYFKLKIQSNIFKGDISIPKKTTYPFRFDVNKIIWNKDIEIKKEDVFSSINPEVLPNSIVNVDSLIIHNVDYGSIHCVLRPYKNGKYFDQVAWSLPHTKFNGYIIWLYDKGKHFTKTNMLLDSTKFEELESVFGIKPFFFLKKAHMSYEYSWNSHPFDFHINSMKGVVGFDAKEGVFKHMNDTQTGSLKLLGVFNAQAIFKRLLLNFNDLFSKGITFDRVTGKLQFNEGMISITESIKMKGSTLDTLLNGKVFLKSNRLDLNLLATVPITKNLPTIGLLFGNIPFAGMLWLVDKIAGNSINRTITSQRYKITGTFDKPIVKQIHK